MSVAYELANKLRSEHNIGGPSRVAECVHALVESKDPEVGVLNPTIPGHYEHGVLEGIYEFTTHVLEDSTMYPHLAGEAINAKVLYGWNQEAAIADKLVTISPSIRKNDTVAGYGGIAIPDEEILEGTPYPRVLPPERSYDVHNEKRGSTLEICEEDMLFGRGADKLRLAEAMGRAARRLWEKQIIERVCEIVSGVYKPDGTETTLYASGNSNLITSNAFGLTGLGKADAAVRDATDENGDSILAYCPQILVPAELYTSALNVTKDLEQYTVLTSPFLTSATDWWAGDFRQEFVYTEVWPIRTEVLGPKTFSDRDILMIAGARYYGNVTAVDYRLVIKNTA